MSENLLRHEASPYLLQHQDNPVHWRPWGPQALAEARLADKPILLSVGYAACHWCHVMAHESFEDAATAAVMNRLFVNIKVDREERPDVDQIYMAALHALGEQGGWPLTMFLTPDGEPIWGGTYFPNTARYGRAAFVDVLEEVSRVYYAEKEKINHNKGLLLEALARRRPAATAVLDRDLLDRAGRRLLELVDRRNGGISGAPKFPQASMLELLWRAGLRTKDPAFIDAIALTLRHISQGGIYDHIGGGFSRYSVDERWLVPHFEKMLYDNAQLIDLLALAHIRTGEKLFATRIEETVAWLLREMRTTDGAFAASVDADSEGHEGRFYVWTRSEIISVLGDDDGNFFAGVYDITEDGNWEGVSILNRLETLDPLSDADEARLTALRARLLVRRGERVRPGLDDKILADWNGLMIAALAFAGAALGRPAWIDMADGAYRFVTTSMMRGDRLAHSWRAGKSVFPGLATDYAAMIRGALALHAATQDAAYLAGARRLAASLRRHHFDDESPGYFLSADDAEALIIRPRSNVDEATPSANALMTQNLVRLWRLTGDDAYRDDADRIIAASAPAVVENVFAAAGLLNGLDLRLGATDVVVIAPSAADGGAGAGTGNELLDAARRHATPNMILAAFADGADVPANHPAAGKSAIEGRATAYVCHGETCSLPVTDAAALVALLG